MKWSVIMPTPSMEDYIEQIYILIETKGYARVSDMAEELDVHPSSVTKMIQKLDKSEYVNYEKYRGFVLTSKGKEMGGKGCYIAMICLKSSWKSLEWIKRISTTMLKELNII